MRHDPFGPSTTPSAFGAMPSIPAAGAVVLPSLVGELAPARPTAAVPAACPVGFVAVGMARDDRNRPV
ncbi:hypothetical protein [Bifidobacterium myosotis]|uniref:Uncharacterized protein n=1 Tax=Bifidobacterium myosotis TaxID=1630166 RepID=A0A5M9ZHU9_9BIFI|nr:hypothetical protein [Bifidobacterium myosotis]KAA8826953.1 hypothetical protein EMO91_10505 [Bifidobacterium myosotis]